MIAIPFILNSLFNFFIGLLVAKFLGPSEYGRFAVVMSIAVVLQSIFFDGLRLSATRFYSEHDRLTHPEIRSTIGVLFVALAGLALIVAATIALLPIDLPLSKTLVVLTIVATIANGLFDLSTALVRARFLDRAYGVLVIAKNFLAIVLCVAGAWYFHSTAAVLIASIISVAGSLALNSAVLRDDAAKPRDAHIGLVFNFAAYALPIVCANLLYQAIPMINRSVVSQVHNFAEAGQLALSFETGIRIIGALGTALDVLLFQLAVLAEKKSGVLAAQQRISANIGVVFAFVLPIVAGCWLIMPSFEHIFIPEHFRGPFGYYFTLMLPAMLAFALINYGFGPAFQIARRTASLIICGLVALISNWLALVFLPASQDATSFALAQSISSCAALATMIVIYVTLDVVWPRLLDIVGALMATAVMVAVVAPTRSLTPSLVTLFLQVGLGICIYGAIAYAFDVARLRSLFGPIIKAWLATRLAMVSKTSRSVCASDEFGRK